MANVVLVAVVFGLTLYAATILLRRTRGIVAGRGMSIGADLGMLADAPQVQVRTVRTVGPDRVHLVLAPDPGRPEGPPLELIVLLSEEDPGFALLRLWKQSEAWLAIVMPPASHIVRLRSIEDLQPLSLRRVDPNDVAPV